MNTPDPAADSMRARLHAELRAAEEESAREVGSRPGGVFSLGLIAVAAWLGLGFGGIVLTCLNDARLGNRPVWRSAGWFCVWLVVSIGMWMPFAAHLTGWTGYIVGVLVDAGGATLIAMTVQGPQLMHADRESRPIVAVVAAIVIGWGLSACFVWILRLAFAS